MSRRGTPNSARYSRDKRSFPSRQDDELSQGSQTSRRSDQSTSRPRTPLPTRVPYSPNVPPAPNNAGDRLSRAKKVRTTLPQKKKQQYHDEALQEYEQERHRLLAAAYTIGGVDWSALFRSMDKKHNGKITLDGFRRAIRVKAGMPSHMFSDKACAALFMAVDLDNSGSVEPEELVKWLDPSGKACQLSSCFHSLYLVLSVYYFLYHSISDSQHT